ncbi:hypothetical protein [Paenibacillus sp. yr247]|nr:hypothetical protein [Paenibacillus sp. yr247]
MAKLLSRPIGQDLFDKISAEIRRQQGIQKMVKVEGAHEWRFILG